MKNQVYSRSISKGSISAKLTLSLDTVPLMLAQLLFIVLWIPEPE